MEVFWSNGARLVSETSQHFSSTSIGSSGLLTVSLLSPLSANSYQLTNLLALAGFFTGLMKGVGASQRIIGLHAMPSPIPLSIGEPVPRDRAGVIELRGVEFAYPSRPHVKVLDGLNLRIEKGDRIALV